MYDDELEEAIGDLVLGGAVCLVGAGFSLGATDANGKTLPSTSDLEKEIRKLAGIDAEEQSSLQDLAEYCDRKEETRAKLRLHLQNRLTLTNPKTSHKVIMNLPWRSIFTTNFDDLCEQACDQRNRYVVSPNTRSPAALREAKPIYYLHGRARDILDGHVKPELVISESNYLQLKDREPSLFASLENELYTAKRIFFIGYSLRDVEIASRVFSIPSLRDRGVVITRENPSDIEAARLEKFGRVYPIGVDGFAEAVSNFAASADADRSQEKFIFIEKFERTLLERDFVARDVEGLLLSGEFNSAAYLRQLTSDGRTLYSISRGEKIANFFEAIATGTNRFLVTSDLGNGKSIFVSQLTVHASQRDYTVLRINSNLREIFEEIERAIKLPGRKLFIIEDIIRHRQVAKFLGARLPGESVLLVTSREIPDKSEYTQIGQDLGGNMREINIDKLSNSELEAWDEFLEMWGLWGARIEDRSADRLKFLSGDCAAENRSIVISTFKNSALAKRIEGLVEYFLSRNSTHRRSFIAILINSLCQKHVSWSRIVAWIDIDESSLRRAVLNSSIMGFMEGKSNWMDFASTQLADHILNNFEFESEEIVDVYVKIVRETAYAANDRRSGFNEVENLKELMRFRFLTRLLGSRVDGLRSISAVYERLRSVPRIRENDQFWLQYAMARMEEGDLENAETYLSTAFGIASKKGEDYQKHQIVDQQIRLRLRKAADRTLKLNKLELSKAIDDLQGELENRKSFAIHPLRSARLLEALLENKIDEMSAELLGSIRVVGDLMKARAGEGSRLEKSQKGETEVIRRSVRNILIILSNY